MAIEKRPPNYIVPAQRPAATSFGYLSWALGITELLMPKLILRWLGVGREMAPLVRAFGLREISSGVGILRRPKDPRYMWSRVAGDALDMAALVVALRGRSYKPNRVVIAFGLVAAITMLDVTMSQRMNSAER